MEELVLVDVEELEPELLVEVLDEVLLLLLELELPELLLLLLLLAPPPPPQATRPRETTNPTVNAFQFILTTIYTLAPKLFHISFLRTSFFKARCARKSPH